MDIIFEAIDEDRPGEKWRRVFDRYWHAYSRWFLREGIHRRSTYLDGLKAVDHFFKTVLRLFAQRDVGTCRTRGCLGPWCPRRQTLEPQMS